MRSRRPSVPTLAVLEGGREPRDPNLEFRSTPLAMLPAVVQGGRLGTFREEEHLDAAVERIRALKGDHMMSGWHLGAALIPIQRDDLWKLRLDVDGSRAWRTWELFCERELGITRQYAKQLVDIATRYSEDDARALSTTSLKHLLRLPPGEKHDALFELAKQGAPVRELEAKVNEVRPRKPRAPRKTKAQVDAENNKLARDSAAAHPDRNTAIVALSEPLRVPMVDGVGRHEFANGVAIYIRSVRAPGGGREFVIEFRREDTPKGGA